MKIHLKEFFHKYRFCFPAALLLGTLHLLIIRGRACVTFTLPPQPRTYVYGIICLAIAFCYFFYLICSMALVNLLTKNRAFLSYFKYFLFYFLFMGIFWLMTWPGIFKGDEFYVIRSALNFTLSGAQSGLTSTFYCTALLFFPSMASIVLLQLIIICSIFAVVMHDLMPLFSGKYRFLLYVPFVLLPVIDANLFTLRATLVGWIFLLVTEKLFYLTKTASRPLGQVILICVCSGLLMAWRSENLYLVLLIPLFFLLTKQAHVKQALCMLLLISVCYVGFNIPNKIALNGSNKYPISLVLNPLANLFTEAENLKGPCVYDDIMTINELVDVPLLRQSASVRNISQYWNIDDILPQQQLTRFMHAALRLIVYNPDKFFKYRWQTFAYTNSLYPNYINHPGGECVDAINSLVYYETDYKAMFVMMRPPLGQSFREKVISLLALRTYQQGNIKTSWLLPVFYNCIPTAICLLILLATACIRRRRLLILLTVLVFAQCVLIFLTAPAMFFMYYFCFYLSGYFLTALGICELLSTPAPKPA